MSREFNVVIERDEDGYHVARSRGCRAAIPRRGCSTS